MRHKDYDYIILMMDVVNFLNTFTIHKTREDVEENKRSEVLRTKMSMLILGQLLGVFPFCLLIIIPPLLETHLSPLYEFFNIPEQATHLRTPDSMLRASSLNRQMACLTVKAGYFLFVSLSYD